MTRHNPTSEADALAIVAEAAAQRTPLAIQGSATKRAFGRPPQFESTLSSSQMTKVTLYEPAEFVISAEPGASLSGIVRLLAEHRQELAFEPLDYRPLLGSDGEPTIGAVAAMNLSGPRRIAGGSARDSSLGARFVNGRGEAIKSGGRVMKNVTGLDLVKLMVGAHGTLGFLTEVTFKVVPSPQRVATLCLVGLSDRTAIAALSAALGSPYDVSGAAHLPAKIGGGARTLIRVEGFPDSVEYRLGELRSLLKAFGTAEVLADDTGKDLWMAIRDATVLAEPRDKAIWRISTAPTKGADVAARIARTIDARWFFDWGGGLIWLACSTASAASAATIRAATGQAGGHATLVRAPEDVRAAVDVFHPPVEAIARLQTGLKASLDPAGIFNPGRMFPEL
ncbi:glycolate oxidase FAD binding subunit [Bradyrhizobium brasilense]|uniref:Glycolate oxidase FAD binding subunit n=1 Tax=Bradyrhizobium brasilense TaxID=1419277 RepID=A0A1G6XIC1_9BRAD|nr:FAD-binding protein [Bradyrhizobium brasilense]SDD77949.1 glycolate oxidase FAD binding subunit [Bradyrhizobium brasilense]